MEETASGSCPMAGNSGVEPSGSVTTVEVVMDCLRYYHNACQKGVKKTMQNTSHNLELKLGTSQI